MVASTAVLVPVMQWVDTLSIAFLTLSDLIRPFSARFVIKAALVDPEDRQAMTKLNL